MPIDVALARQQLTNGNPWMPQTAVPDAVAQYAADEQKANPGAGTGGPITIPEVDRSDAPAAPANDNAHRPRPAAVKPQDGLQNYVKSLQHTQPGLLPKPEQAPVPQGGPATPAALGAVRVPGQGGGAHAGPSPDEKFLGQLTGFEKREEAAGQLDEASIRAQAKAREDGARDLATAQLLQKDEEDRRKQEIEDNEAILNQQSEQRMAARKQRAAEVRAMHVDPQKWYKDRGTAGTILAAVAVAAGAFAAAMPHGSGKNYAQEIIDKSIQRDVDAQQSDIDKAWRDLDFQSADDDKMYAQGQHRLASMLAAKADAWNHAQAQIQGVMMQTQDKVQLAGMDQLLSHAQRQEIGVEKEYADLYRNVGNHILAQNAALANKGAATQKEIVEYAKKLYADPNFQPNAGAKSREEAALRAAESLHNMNPQNAGFGAVAKEGKLSDDAQTNRASAEFNQQIEDLRKDPIFTEGTFGAAALSHLPGGVAPKSNAAQVKLDSVNTRMLQAVGKVAKDADGKPNKEMIDRIERKYEMHLTDTAAQKQQKLQAVQDIVNALARQQGAANAPLSTMK